MQKIFTGKAHVYNKNNINTDEIIPARRMNIHEEAHLAKFAMEDLDKDFINKVQDGDFIIAGENFGCGSSREHAIWALRGAGIKAVIAKSFARIFYRNAVNNGFLAIESAEVVDKISNSDELEINTEKGEVKNLNTGDVFSAQQIPDFVFEIAEKGGLLNTI